MQAVNPATWRARLSRGMLIPPIPAQVRALICNVVRVIGIIN